MIFKHKSLIALLIGACTAVVSLTGCKKQQPASDSAQQVIGIAIPAADHGWTGGVVFWANQVKAEIEKNYGMKVVIATASTSAEQVDKIENLMTRKISALVVLPNEPQPLTNVCTKVAQNGIKLVVVDRGLSKDVQDLYVAGDNAGFGRCSAEVIARELKGKGNIVVMEGVPCQVNTARIEAFRQVMKKYPGIHILDSQSSNWQAERGLTLMENFLQKYSHIDAVWAGDDDVLSGVLKAYQESKRKDVRLFVGGGGSKFIVKKILDGDPLVRQTVTYPPKMIYVAALEAAKMLKGTMPEKKVLIVPAEEVNGSNAKNYYFPSSSY